MKRATCGASAALLLILGLGVGINPAYADDSSAPTSTAAVEAVKDIPAVDDQTVTEEVSPAGIPENPSAPVTFENLPVNVSVVSDGTTRTTQTEGLTVFSGTAQSTTTVVQPTEDGARLMSVLNDASASTASRYKITLNEGASLQPLGDGSIAIVDAQGGPVGAIDAPWATDAQGSPVPTTYSLDGNTLVQVVTPNDSTTFPVVADPALYGYSMNGAEFSFCKWPSRYSICTTAFRDSSTATNAAQTLYSDSLHNGRGDAFRHCFWSALMTVHMGRATAAGFGDRHEMVDGEPHIEYVMDQRNNAIGRDDVGQWTSSTASAKSQCRARANDGRLWWISNGRLV